jgi:hypothetical protein
MSAPLFELRGIEGIEGQQEKYKDFVAVRDSILAELKSIIVIREGKVSIDQDAGTIKAAITTLQKNVKGLIGQLPGALIGNGNNDGIKTQILAHNNLIKNLTMLFVINVWKTKVAELENSLQSSNKVEIEQLKANLTAFFKDASASQSGQTSKLQTLQGDENDPLRKAINDYITNNETLQSKLKAQIAELNTFVQDATGALMLVGNDLDAIVDNKQPQEQVQQEQDGGSMKKNSRASAKKRAQK